MWCITSSKWGYPTRLGELSLLLLTQDPGAHFTKVICEHCIRADCNWCQYPVSEMIVTQN